MEATAIVTASDGSVAAPVELYLSKGHWGLQITMAGVSEWYGLSLSKSVAAGKRAWSTHPMSVAVLQPMRVSQVHDVMDLTKGEYHKTILPAMGLPNTWRNRVHSNIMDGYALHVNFPGYTSKVRGSCPRRYGNPTRALMAVPPLAHVIRIRRT
jgi:hypothetical protein